MVDLKVKLNGIAQQTDNLMKENSNLKSEVATLHEHMEKVKKEAIEEYQGSNPISMKFWVIIGTALRTFVSASCPFVPKLGLLLNSNKA